MFFPIRTDRRLTHTPWVNYGLIAVNVLIFMTTRSTTGEPVARDFVLEPALPQLHQFITYQFLHADHWHLLGNMLFLYVFGNSVEDRLGKVGYLGFYLAGGVLAGLGHALTDQNPVLGASGAVAAITGAYLALFPLSNVTVVYWFILIGSFEVSSMLLILFQIGQNVVLHMMGGSRVAYMAHLSGYAYGFVVGAGLLWLHLLPREPYDLLALIEQRRRRSQFRRMTRDGYHPWEHAKATEPDPVGGQKPAEPISDEKQRHLDLRQQINSALSQQNLPAAARLYHQLLLIDPKQVMGQQQQLDLSNQLMSEGRYDAAAQAYELFLRKFDRYAQREQIELILGLIYVKYLDRRDRGCDLLTAALPRLDDQRQKELAQRMLSEA